MAIVLQKKNQMNLSNKNSNLDIIEQEDHVQQYSEQ